MTFYRCNDGDRIDLIVLKHYGDLEHLNDVISANKQLFDKPMVLISGMTIELPDFSVTVQAEILEPKERVPLW